MNYNEAVFILKLDQNFTSSQLKKQYYKMSLQYHPDKNPYGEDTFKSITEAYQILSNSNKEALEPNMNTLSEYLKYVLDIDPETFTLVQNIINKSIEKTNETLNQLDKQVFEKINRFLLMYKNVFKVSDQTMQSIFDESNHTSHYFHIIKPTIDDIMHQNIHVFSYNKTEYYVPSWQHELIYDDITIYILPTIPKHIFIDNNNDIHIDISISKTKVFETDTLEIEISNKQYTIETNTLYIKKIQSIYLKKKGIPRIIKDDIYSTKELSDIIVHIHII